jgi:hypothetical protein
MTSPKNPATSQYRATPPLPVFDPSHSAPRAYSGGALRRMVIVAGVVPVAFALIGAGLMLSWLPELPSGSRVGWGAGGAPDGYGSLAGLLAILIGYVVIFSAIVLVSLLAQRATAQVSSRPRLLVAITVWLAATITVGITGLVGAQRGLTDAAEAGSVVAPFVIGVGIGLTLGVAAWFITPLPARLSDEVVDSKHATLQLGSSERVTWTRSARPARKTVLWFIVIFALLAAGVLPLTFTESPWMWSVIALLLVVLASSTVCFYWRVSVDRRGVLVRSSIWFSKILIPLDEIASARVVDINPFMDFGGWGWRWAAGTTGIVVRAGEALEVTRTSGKILVVTVDDAATAVSLLEGLRRRGATDVPPASA